LLIILLVNEGGNKSMIGSLLYKTYLNIVSLSVLLFSNYVGNSVSFSPLSMQNVGDNIVCSAHLLNAFENDFEEIFKSGKEIRVWFEFKALNNSKIIHFEKFYHAFKWDVKSRVYYVELQEQSFTTTAKTTEELVYLLSVVEFPFYRAKHRGNISIELTAYLPKIYMDEINKEFDLMLLWNLKKPSVKKEINII